MQGDPTEGALVVAARKVGLNDETLDARFERVGEVPFSSERRLMTTIHAGADRQERLLVFTKSAPDVLLARCSQELVGQNPRVLSDARRAEILQANDELAGQALRTLGVATRTVPADALQREEANERLEQELTFLGLIGMIDPPRQEAKETVARARRAGIRPIMITGDHPRTAAVIAGELGITTDGRVVTGAELERLSNEALAQMVRDVSVYARVNPEHKLRIVKALQRGGGMVAMTGDGVNDAPALKTADIGVAILELRLVRRVPNDRARSRRVPPRAVESGLVRLVPHLWRSRKRAHARRCTVVGTARDHSVALLRPFGVSRHLSCPSPWNGSPVSWAEAAPSTESEDSRRTNKSG